MVNGASRIAPHLTKLALLIALGEDAFAGEFAGLELRPLRLFFGGRLLGTNRGVFVEWERCAAFVLLSVGRTDLY